jgi:predicted RNA-binding Zn ribbon-like protein
MVRMVSPEKRVASSSPGFIFIAGSLWLDFVNTRFAGAAGPVERLTDFAALGKWCIESGAFERGPLTNTLKQIAGIVDNKGVLAHALEFRAALHEMATRLAAGKSVPAASLEAINSELLRRAGYTQVDRAGDEFHKRFLMQIDSPFALLVPVALSAADLLTSGEPDLIRKCANPDCVLFFYDKSKNHRRRWCSMKACGNRTKAASYYARQKVASA